MKKITMGVLFVCITAMISGCTKKNDEQISRMEGMLGLVGSAAAEDKCIYEKDRLLHIQDIKTNQSMIFCSKPDCKHEPLDEVTNPDPECEAALRPGCMNFLSVGLYENKVYAFESSSKKVNKMILYSKDITGQGWSKIGTIPYEVDDNAKGYYVDGYAYIAGHAVINPSHIGETGQEECVLLKVNLSNGKYEELGTKYSANGWCRMQKLDYSDGMLCYEVTRLKEGYTEGDIENLPTSEWELILGVTVAVVNAKTGEEEKIGFKDFLYGQYICYNDGLLYYRDGSVVTRWDVKHQEEGSAIGEVEEGASVRPYPPIGIMIDNGKEQRIYNIKKSRWIAVKNPEGVTETLNNGINNYTSRYVRAHCVIGNTDEDALFCDKWVTWEDYIDGIWMPQKGDSDVVTFGGEDSGTAGSTHVEPVLDDAYYEEHWRGKTILTWWVESEVSPHIIAKLNDTLVEKGRDYVIREKVVEYYKDEYFDSLVDARNNREALDVFVTPTEFEGDKPENKYKKCVKAGLLEPLDDFLASDKGNELYNEFDKRQWDAMKVDGKIYSYDNRTMIGSDIYLVVNQEYIDKYGFTVNDTTTMEDVFRMAQEVSEKENNKSLIPILWMGSTEQSVREASIEGLSELRNKYKNLFCYWDSSSGDSNLTTFARFETSSLESLSDTESVFNLPGMHIEKIKRILVKKHHGYFPITNGLTAVASWSKHKEEAMDFISLANTDKDIATILQFGVEDWDYTLEDGRIKNGESSVLDIANKRITPPYRLEPDDKEAVYRKYVEERLNE